MSRFEFLKKDYLNIYRFCEEAEFCYNNSRYNSCLNQMRSALELVLIDLVGPKRNGNLQSKIDKLSKFEKNNEIVSKMQVIRDKGNKGSHPVDVFKVDVDQTFDALSQVMIWYVLEVKQRIIFKPCDFAAIDYDFVKKYGKQVQMRWKRLYPNYKQVNIQTSNLDIGGDFCPQTAHECGNLIKNDEQISENIEVVDLSNSNTENSNVGYKISEKRTNDIEKN